MELVFKRPRPSFASAFADTVRDDVVYWISKTEARIGPDAYKSFIATLPSDDGEFRRLLETAMRGGTGDTDAFRIASDLQSYLDWPVNEELVAIIANAVRQTKDKSFRQAVIAWVMETGTRFHPKAGDEITYRGDNFTGQRSGRVVEVDRPIASAIVADANGTRTHVRAENVIKAA